MLSITIVKGEKVNMAEFRINLNGNIDYSTDTDKDCYSFKLVTKKDKNGIEHRGWEMKYVGKDQETTGISKIPDKIIFKQNFFICVKRNAGWYGDEAF